MVFTLHCLVFVYNCIFTGQSVVAFSVLMCSCIFTGHCIFTLYQIDVYIFALILFVAFAVLMYICARIFAQISIVRLTVLM